MARSSLLLNIESARGLAAMGILIAHIVIFGVNKFGLGTTALFRVSAPLLGFVDLFFLISGVVMMQANRKQSPLLFLARRALRIYPLYWLICLPLIPVLLWWPQLINASSPVPTSILHSLLLFPHAGLPLLMVAWTLEFEMYFYLLFAQTIILSRERQVILLSTWFLLCVTLGLWFRPESAALRLVTSPFLLEFAAGMVLGFYLDKIAMRKAFALVAIVFGLLYVAVIPIDVLPRVAHYGVGMTLALTGLLGLEKNGKTLSEKTSGKLGAISYPLYLVQVPVIVGIGRGFQWLGYPLPPFLYVVTSFIASIAIAEILAWFIDQPLQRKFRRPDSRLATHFPE
jgi:exopolysaccharide production protein ExoZ